MKKINNQWYTDKQYIELLESRINNAIKYLESYHLPAELRKLSEALIFENELKDLLKILKGE